MNFDELMEEVKESMLKMAEAGRMEERERVLTVLSEVLCGQYDEFTKRINAIWMPEFVDANLDGLGSARIKRVKEVLEDYLRPDIFREAKAKGYDPNNLPPCELCGKIPETLASAPDMGEVMVDHECDDPDLRFTGPGHLWFLCEHKGEKRGKS